MSRQVFEKLDYLRSMLEFWMRKQVEFRTVHGKNCKWRDIEIGRVKRAIFLLENSEQPYLRDFFGDSLRN